MESNWTKSSCDPKNVGIQMLQNLYYFISTLDEKMSDKYLSKSCELGSVVGCYNYANFKKMSDETVSI